LSDDRLLEDPEILRQYLTVVRGRAEGLVRIVSELTTFADLVTGAGLPTHMSQRTTLRQLLLELGHGRQMRVELTDEADAAPIDLDRVQLVLHQLVDNAFKFGTPGAEVVVRAFVQPEVCRLIVRVTNSGPPIPADLRGSIFAAYRQAEPTDTRRKGGLGLGLAVASHAAEGAGGSLVLEADEPTTFRLELPLREDPIARQATALREHAALMDAQALRAIQDMRKARAAAEADLHKEVVETVRLLLSFLERRWPERVAQCRGAARLAARMASSAGLTPEETRGVQVAALLQDVGLIALPDALLRTGSAGLSAAERSLHRQHPLIASETLGGRGFAHISAWIRHHHERWDGSGYPDGLAGEDIPLPTRILALATGYVEAVTREGGTATNWRREQVSSGAFDPSLIGTLERIVRQRE
jgi:two-component sensor histidine kinase